MSISKLAKLGVLLLVVLFMGGLDQWSKYLLGVWLPTQNWQWGLTKLVWYKNPWIAFSIPLPMTVAVVLIIGLLILLVVLLVNSRRTLGYDLGLMLVISGGLSNLWDKWQLGYVRDFVSIWWLPVFNLADMLIFIGVVMVILNVAYGKRHQKI